MTPNGITYDWRVIAPKSTKNYCVNSSLEAVTTVGVPFGWTLATGAGITSAQQAFGVYSLGYSAATVQNVATQALNVVNPATCDAVWMSAYMYLTAYLACGVKLLKTSDSTVLGTALADPTKLNQWQRVSVRVTGVGHTLSAVTIAPYVAASAVSNGVYWDGFQVEDSYSADDLSTYFDGDTRGCFFAGVPHQSVSVRPLGCRSGGVEVSLSDYMHITGMTGAGMCDVLNVTIPNGLLGSSAYQRSIRQPRAMNILGTIFPPESGGTIDDLHGSQLNLEMLLNPHTSMPQEPERLVYSSGVPGSKELTIDGLYEGGLEFSSLEGLTLGSVPLRFNCPDSRFAERLEKVSAELVGMEVDTNQSCAYRPPFDPNGIGAFQGVGTSALNALPDCLEWIFPPQNAHYNTNPQCLLAGGFTGGGGGSAVALRTFDPTNIAAGVPYVTTNSALAVPHIYAVAQAGAGNKYVWMGGDDAGSGYLYRLDLTLASGQYTVPFAAVDGIVRALAYDPTTDTLYVGGDFANPYAHLFKVTGASGASPTVAAVTGSLVVGAASVRRLCLRGDGRLYACVNTAAACYVLWYTGSAWATIGTLGAALGQPHMMWGSDGYLYLSNETHASVAPGATSAGLARYNGSSWEPVGDASWYDVIGMGFDTTGRLHICGGITGSVAGAPNPDSGTHGHYAVCEGRSLHVEALVPTGAFTNAFLLATNPFDGSIFVAGYTDSVPSIPASTTVTYTGTAPCPVRLIYRRTSTAGCLGSIRNERTGQGVYFNGLLVGANETVYVDMISNEARVWSDQRPDLMSFVAPISDIGNFALFPGENYIQMIDDGGGNGYLVYTPRHYSIDGAFTGTVTPTRPT